jgi:hypothetical protein
MESFWGECTLCGRYQHWHIGTEAIMTYSQKIPFWQTFQFLDGFDTSVKTFAQKFSSTLLKAKVLARLLLGSSDL